MKHFVRIFQLGSYNLVSHIGQVEKKWVPTIQIKASLQDYEECKTITIKKTQGHGNQKERQDHDN